MILGARKGETGGAGEGKMEVLVCAVRKGESARRRWHTGWPTYSMLTRGIGAYQERVSLEVETIEAGPT